MGTTFGGEIPDNINIDTNYALETWNRKRIGVAVADSIYGEFVRKDKPLLEPRDCRYWDCTITTNPSVAIMPDGKTYMIYKSRASVKNPLKLGVAVADSPDGEFTRHTELPLFEGSRDEMSMEDPYLWYDEKKGKFCVIAKDDAFDTTKGVTGEWGSGFYSESENCKDFTVGDNPKVYSRTVEWADGKITTQGNLERPGLLFDENGEPTHIFCASGTAENPYAFEGRTYIVCIKLEKK